MGAAKKNLHQRVELVPTPCRLDERGQKLPDIDYDCIIECISDKTETVGIAFPASGHHITLGKDHIYKYTTNPARSTNGVQHGFLTLHVQVFLQGQRAWVRPNTKPGDPVEPSSVMPDTLKLVLPPTILTVLVVIGGCLSFIGGEFSWPIIFRIGWDAFGMGVIVYFLYLLYVFLKATKGART